MSSAEEEEEASNDEDQLGEETPKNKSGKESYKVSLFLYNFYL